MAVRSVFSCVASRDRKKETLAKKKQPSSAEQHPDSREIHPPKIKKGCLTEK
jgi:hypothetical protein